MACDCGCTDTSINCNCPAPLVTDGAQLAYVTSTTFDGAPVDIYNGGVGYSINLYTNTGTVSHYVIIDTNTYITSTNPHTLATSYSLNAAATPSGNAGVLRYTSAPIKTTASYYSVGIVLSPGQSLWFNILSGDSTAKANWLTAFIYIYEI
jgi:hypothetical protein